MVLAAGRGERMRPLTAERAKPTLPVLGVPLLSRLVRHLAAEGIEALAVNAHHGAASIEAAIASAALPNVRLALFHERQQLMGSGGALDAPRGLLAESPCFLLHNADTLVRAPTAALLHALNHAPRDERRIGVLLARPGLTPGLEGAIVVDRDLMVDRVRGREALARETRPLASYLGVGLLRREVLDSVAPNTPSDLFGDVLLPWLRDGWRFAVVWYQGPWLEFTSPRSYLRNVVRAVIGARRDGSVPLPGGDAAIQPTDTGAAFLAEGASAHVGARLAGGVILEREAVVDRGAQLRDALLLPGAVVATGAHLQRVVVDAGVVVPSGSWQDGTLHQIDGRVSFTPFDESA